MGTTITLIVLVLIVAGVIYLVKGQAAAKQRQLDDAVADARRLVERLGGQVLNLTGSNIAAQQAMADASERYNAAGSQIEQARTSEQARLVKETAIEGLYYVRAARIAMDMDPGPALPEDAERQRAGKVSEHRRVDVEGQEYEASPNPTDHTPHYYPGGRVAGRPVPQGWYSEPWWKPALVAGAWGLGSMFLFSAMFSGMSGVPTSVAEPGGGDGGDGGGDSGNDSGGSDNGGGDTGGGDQGFDSGGDFGGQDFGGGFDF